MLQALRVFGGIILDLEYVCEKPFDELSFRYSFFTSLEPSLPWNKIPSTPFTVIGASPDHPLTNILLNKFSRYYTDTAYRAFINEHTDMDEDTPKDMVDPRASHLVMGYAVEEFCKNGDQLHEHCRDVIVFPPSYFSPFLVHEHYMMEVRTYS